MSSTKNLALILNDKISLISNMISNASYFLIVLCDLIRVILNYKYKKFLISHQIHVSIKVYKNDKNKVIFRFCLFEYVNDCSARLSIST